MSSEETVTKKKKKKTAGAKTSKSASSGKKKAKAKKKRAPLLTPAQKKIFRNFIGVIFAFLSVYTLVAVVSYMFSWDADQSLLSAGAETELAHNGGGTVGYGWARLLVTRMFGIGSLAVVVFLASTAWCLLKDGYRYWRLVMMSFFAAFILSLTAAFLERITGDNSIFGDGLGGAYGTAFISEGVALIGNFGVIAVLIVLAIVFSLLSSTRFANWFTNLGDNIPTSLPLKGVSAEEQDTAADEPDMMADGSEDGCDEGEDEDDEEDEEEEYEDEYEDEDEDDETEEEDEDEQEETVEDDNDKWSPLPVRENPVPVSEPVHVETAPPMQVTEMGLDDGQDVPDGAIQTEYDPHLDLPHYRYPTLDLLKDYNDQKYEVSNDELARNNRQITSVLSDYGVVIENVSAMKGPTVTLYKIVLGRGTRVAQLKRLEEDIAIAMGVKGVRVLPLTNSIGIEVPNERASVVPLKSLLADRTFMEKRQKFNLPVVMGFSVMQNVLAFDLAKAPHLLIAGATGQGKSVGLNSLLTSLLYTMHPSELKFVLVDPKRVELSIYNTIRNHFLACIPEAEKPILTETDLVVKTLKSLCVEMEARYLLLEAAQVRDIVAYNEKFKSRKLNPNNGHRFLPYIVVVIDEFADLLILAGKDIEVPISRLAAKARAIGIHLIIATQRPTTDVITGTIKANFPSRIGFKVTQSVDSKTILDETGANRLIGKGDMLVRIAGEDIVRAQCALVSTEETIAVSDFIGEQRGYGSPYYLPECDDEEEGPAVVDLSKRDALFDEAARLIVSSQQGSTSYLQRKMEIGYNRAGRLMDQLEAAGIVGPNAGSKPRAVLISDFDELEEKLKAL